MSSNFTCENNLFEIIRKNNNYTIKFDPKNCDKTLARKITEIFRSENGIESDDYIEHEVNHDEIVNRIVFSSELALEKMIKTINNFITENGKQIEKI